MFDVANATWYRLVAYACQNLPVHRDAGGDQETPQDTGYGKVASVNCVRLTKPLLELPSMHPYSLLELPPVSDWVVTKLSRIFHENG